MLVLNRIHSQFEKTDIVEKFNIIPVIGTFSNIGFLAVKILQSSHLVKYPSHALTYLNKHSFTELFLTSLPIFGTLYRLVQLSLRIKQVEKEKNIAASLHLANKKEQQRIAADNLAAQAITLKEKEIAARVQTENKAALLIQKTGRGHLARVHLRHEHKVAQVQTENKAVLLIQKTARGHLARVHLRHEHKVARAQKENKAALLIQKITRGHLARSQATRLQINKENQKNAFFPSHTFTIIAPTLQRVANYVSRNSDNIKQSPFFNETLPQIAVYVSIIVMYKLLNLDMTSESDVI